MLARDYRFYLSFENSNCRNYVTEKLFTNALKYFPDSFDSILN
jgi:glycoprotein 3-alpha-L-fucosyltransferase